MARPTNETTARGARLPTEKRVLHGDRTGAEIWQLTSAPSNNHAPHFLNPAWAGPRHDRRELVDVARAFEAFAGTALPT